MEQTSGTADSLSVAQERTWLVKDVQCWHYA